MSFREGRNRDQIELGTLSHMVAPDSIARVIDAVVDSMDLTELGFDRTNAADTGRPAFEAGCMLKLYIYGNLEGIRSSRKLEQACRVNVEVIWLMQGLCPDFRTISDFRKRNAGCLKGVFKTFDRKVFDVLTSGFIAVDGTKMLANCAKKNVFMKESIESSLDRLAAKIARYTLELDANDEEEDKAAASDVLTREQAETELAKLQEREQRYRQYRDYMEQNGLSQMSVTDADARMMKTRDGFAVAYNMQTAVDSETHMIREVEVTNQCTDHGLLGPTAGAVKDQDTVLEATADKGYIQPADLAGCLENGIVPHVIPKHGQEKYELEIPYSEADITEEKRLSQAAEDLSECLHAGIIPEAYKDVIEKASIEVRYQTETADKSAEGSPSESPYLNEEDAKARAAQGYFVRDPQANTVICPGGHTLPQKSVRKNGKICYACRDICKNCECRDKCLGKSQTHKEVDFDKDTLEKPHRAWQLAENDGFCPKKPTPRGPMKKTKVVRLIFKPDKARMDKRKELSEHPFGTIKRTLGAGYFLLRGKAKVQGEAALACLGYNIRRALNLLGFDKMMMLFA